MSKYEPTSSGYKEVDADDKDKAAITEGVTGEKKVSATREESPGDKTAKGKKVKGGKKAKGSKSTKETDAYNLTQGGRKKDYPDSVGFEKGASGRRLALETNREIPYPELGGHTVSQLFGMETHKRKAILGPKDDEFVKNYM